VHITHVSARWTAWHFYFTILLRKRGPCWIEVRDEVPLSEERPRIDYLLLRKLLEPPPDDQGQTLRDLWGRLPLITVAELKTVARPYRADGLDRLWSYVHMYWIARPAALEHRMDLAALLLVPSRTPTLDADAEALKLVWNDLGGGYWELTGGPFVLYVVEIDTVTEREDEDLVRYFSHNTEHTLEARRFWAEQIGTKEAMMAVQELEGYDEVVEKFLEFIPPEQRLAGLAPEQRLAGLAPEQRLAGLAPEQRLAGLAPEQRLAGLSREQMILALPDDELRKLPEEYLATFPEPTRAAIRRRCGR
jgi:hypothetical protein